MEDDMTDENKTVETQDLASPPTDEDQATSEQTDTPAEESQLPDKPVQELPADAEEAGEEEDGVQGEPVPFEEDIAPPAHADEAVEKEDEVVVGSETPQEATSEVPAEPVSESSEEAVAEPAQEVEAAESQTAVQEEHPPAETAKQEEPPEQAPTVESVIEAILFATDEPLTDGRLASIVETTAKQVRESIENLNAKYQANNNAFRIEQIAGGYQMLTLNTYNSWLKKMVHARSDSKLSAAALETLAIIAYKQPIIRADIEAVRGVAAGEVIRSLMYKGLVKIVGRAEILGRPMLYGTTKKFLEVFGLNSLKDLPKAEELKNPDHG
jgi:segregation and condensation protein B